jgi:hypothetical protein
VSDAPPGAGWFRDPADPSLVRWWDGARWTAHVQRIAPPAASAPPAPSAAPAAPTKKSRAGLVVSLVSVGVVALLAIGTAVAWGPVSAALTPRYALAEAPFYDSSVRVLDTAFDGAAEDPLGYRGASEAWRQSPAYVAAAREYVRQYLDDYDAEERIFGSSAEADDFAYTETSPEFRDLARALQAGGQGTPLAEQSFPQDPAVVALEQQIAAMPTGPDANGSYWASAAAMAALLNVKLTDDLSLSDCLGLSVEPPAGSFCPSEANWNRVFIHPPGVEEIPYPSFVDLVKHELAHKLIFLQCSGSYGYDFAGSAWSVEYGEGVTNSYAKIYLGADPANLSTSVGYGMNETTDAKAQAIHDGDLACFDDGQAPAPQL